VCDEISSASIISTRLSGAAPSRHLPGTAATLPGQTHSRLGKSLFRRERCGSHERSSASRVRRTLSRAGKCVCHTGMTLSRVGMSWCGSGNGLNRRAHSLDRPARGVSHRARGLSQAAQGRSRSAHAWGQPEPRAIRLEPHQNQLKPQIDTDKHRLFRHESHEFSRIEFAVISGIGQCPHFKTPVGRASSRAGVSLWFKRLAGTLAPPNQDNAAIGRNSSTEVHHRHLNQ
jgi:hypothetical protein